MRKLIYILLFLIPIGVFAQPYYISPTGNDNTGDGSIGSPWFTIDKASDNCSAGDTVFVRGGTYLYVTTQTIGVSGTSGNEVVFISYEDETPIFDFSTYPQSTTPRESINGIYIYNRRYLKFQGLRVTRHLNIDTDNGRAHGWYFHTVHHVYVDQCISDSIAGRGFFAYKSYSLYYTNCDAYDCADPQDADAGNAGTGFLSDNYLNTNKTSDTISYVGCRAWHCSDQGFSTTQDYGVTLLDSCWSFNHGYWVAGAGQGFKLALSPTDSVYRKITNSIAANVLNIGFNDNVDPTGNNMDLYAYNNLSINNGTWGYKLGGGDQVNPFTAHLTNNVSYNNAGDQYTSGLRYTNTTNSWDDPPGITVASTDFLSLPADSAAYITVLAAARKDGGYLPDIGNYFKPSSESQLVDAGTDLGDGDDLGPFQYEAQNPAVLPTVVTVYVYSVSKGTASVLGTISDDGGGTISERGVCYNTTGSPDTGDSTTESLSEDSNFITFLTGLDPETTYYIKAYAINEAGTAYGSEVSFTTLSKTIMFGSDGKPLFGSDGKVIYK